MKVYQTDPTSDRRWTELVNRHRRASVFHTGGWLKALQRTYGYEPVVFTTSSPTNDLKDALVFCRINSWLTGRRLVSLPFSDHCDPLCDSFENEEFLNNFLRTELVRQKWKYIETRPKTGKLGRGGESGSFLPAATYFLHTLNLRPDLSEVFQSLDNDSARRRIQRAERAGLIERCGTSDDLLSSFYGLFVMTRSRHRIPPSPYAWFRNLIHFQGDALTIRVAYYDEKPIAAILTLRFRDTVYYKYGCFDVRFKRLGAMPWLLWKGIEAAKRSGAVDFDMGRTEEDNTGLVKFKNRWVPRPTQLIYWKFPGPVVLRSAEGWKLKMAECVFEHMPCWLLPIVGRLIYPHIG
jgi:GNAT acetyltransferase-like protein